MKVAHLSLYYAVEVQGQVTTLQMSLTSNTKSFKNPTNF